MKNPNDIIFAVVFFLTSLMAVVSYLSYRRHQKRELRNLTELWCSLLGNVLAYYIFRDGEPYMAALSMIGWLWPLKTIGIFLEDITGAALMKRWHFVFVLAGGLATIALGNYEFGFTYLALPLALTVGIVGVVMIFEAFHKTPHEFRTPLCLSIYTFLTILVIERLAFPFGRMNESIQIAGMFVLFISLSGLVGTSLSMYLELLKNRLDLEMDKLIKDRNDKLLGQSKYSELGMMSAGIAHEINNPLAVIQARTMQLLRIYRNPDKQRDLADGLQQILYTSERIKRTIQGLREFVHHDDKETATEISLKNLIDDVMAFTGQRMINHGVNLRFYGIENHSVVGNKVQIEQIILNLLNNSFDAIEFLPDKWIEVSAHPQNDMTRIYFKDSGHGIPLEIASHMMDPFFTTKEMGKGTGLGLALARAIAEKHGGSLEYMNDCEHTTFMLELPRSIEAKWRKTRPQPHDTPVPPLH